jgi:clostripain
MRKSVRVSGALAAVAMLAVMAVPAAMSAGSGSAQWTFMVYLDADNNLEIYGEMNLEWLETVGSDKDVNFLVLMDTYSGVADLLYVNEGSSESVGEAYGYPAEVDMADPEVLEQFIVNGCKDYPADKYALILWDHGGGWRGLCWDDTTSEETGESEFISMVELREALVDAKEETGIVLDVVGFDLCLMAMPEVAYQVRDCCEYVVFSEETVPGAGFPYDAIAEGLVAEPTMDGAGLSEVIVESYGTYYSEQTGWVDWTISAFDMAYMDDVFTSVDDLGVELIASLRDYMNDIQQDVVSAQKYYYPYNVDLKGFAMNLIADDAIDSPALKAAAEDVAEAVEGGIFAMVNSKLNQDSYGLAIYIPSTNDGMHHIKDTYEEIPFGQDTSWYDFALMFSNWTGKNWGQ